MNTQSKYCWHCHKTAADVECARCSLNYHKVCATKLKMVFDLSEPHSKWMIPSCYSCRQNHKSIELHARGKNKNKFTKMGHIKLNRLFKCVVEESLHCVDAKYIKLLDLTNDKASLSIGNYINLTMIKARITSNYYKHPWQLITDMERLVHSTYIDFAELNASKDATDLLVRCKSLLKILDYCPTCMWNDYFERDGRATVCPKIHRPVMIDVSNGVNACSWKVQTVIENLPTRFPGKVVGFKHSGCLMRVVPFGPIERACIKVPKKNVYHLVERDLESFVVEEFSDATFGETGKLRDSIQEAGKYISNIKSVGIEKPFYTQGKVSVEPGHKLSMESDIPVEKRGDWVMRNWGGGAKRKLEFDNLADDWSQENAMKRIQEKIQAKSLNNKKFVDSVTSRNNTTSCT